MKYVELIIFAVNVLVRIAEAFSGFETGENKKSFVVRTIELIIGIFARSSTGGQKETWKGILAAFGELRGPIGDLIEIIVNGLYNVEDETKPPIKFDEVDP